jgi:hypothetical protein
MGREGLFGWGGRIRTYECQLQRLVTYRLSTPQSEKHVLKRRAILFSLPPYSSLKSSRPIETPRIPVVMSWNERGIRPTTFDHAPAFPFRIRATNENPG